MTTSSSRVVVITVTKKTIPVTRDASSIVLQLKKVA